jgi:hypothetical protein
VGRYAPGNLIRFPTLTKPGELMWTNNPAAGLPQRFTWVAHREPVVQKLAVRA